MASPGVLCPECGSPLARGSSRCYPCAHGAIRRARAALRQVRTSMRPAPRRGHTGRSAHPTAEASLAAARQSWQDACRDWERSLHESPSETQPEEDDAAEDGAPETLRRG